MITTPIITRPNRQNHPHKQTKPPPKDYVHLGRVRTQPTVKRFKRGLKRDYKRGGKIPSLKPSLFDANLFANFAKLSPLLPTVTRKE